MTADVDAISTRMHAVATDAQSQGRLLESIMQGLDRLAAMTDMNAGIVAQSVLDADQINGDVARLGRALEAAGADTMAARPA